jgi:hypothetical protein
MPASRTSTGLPFLSSVALLPVPSGCLESPSRTGVGVLSELDSSLASSSELCLLLKIEIGGGLTYLDPGSAVAGFVEIASGLCYPLYSSLL